MRLSPDLRVAERSADLLFPHSALEGRDRGPTKPLLAIGRRGAFLDPTPWRHGSVLMFSKDGGRSWPHYALVTSDPENRVFYWDQRPGVLPDGRILDLFWTFDRRQAVYRNIHARESWDHGSTWSEIWDTGIPGQPAPPVPLTDGRVGLVYVDRSGAPQIRMRASKDGGRTWPEDSQIVLAQPVLATQTRKKHTMQDAWAEMADFSLGLG